MGVTLSLQKLNYVIDMSGQAWLHKWTTAKTPQDAEILLNAQANSPSGTPHSDSHIKCNIVQPDRGKRHWWGGGEFVCA